MRPISVSSGRPAPGALSSSSSGGEVLLGTTGVQGNVTNQSGGAAIGGGQVELWNSANTLVVSTLPVSGAGAYSFDFIGLGIAPGNYNVKYHAPGTHCLGDSEPDFQPVVVVSGAMTPQNFTAQVADYWTDFQNFTTAQLNAAHSGNLLPGEFGYHNGDTNYQTNGWGGVYTNTTIDTVTVPAPYSKAALMDQPANPTFATNATYHPAQHVLSIRPYRPSGFSSIAYRFTDFCSSVYDNGGGGAINAQRENKYCLLQVGPSGGSGVGQIGVYFEQNGNGTLHKTAFDTTDKNGNSINTTPHNNQSTWTTGQWNTWIMWATGLGSSSAVFSLYLNGTRVQQLTGPYWPTLGQLGLGGNDQILAILNEQYNNGPDQRQQRWFREFGIYPKRPNLLTGLAV